jgi:hypothetical protein
VYNSVSTENQIRIRVRWSNNILQFNVGYNISLEKWDAKTGRCKKNTTNKNGDTAFEINKEISRLEALADDLFKPFEVSGYEPSLKEYKTNFNIANGKSTGCLQSVIYSRREERSNTALLERTAMLSVTSGFEHNQLLFGCKSIILTVL